MDGYLTQAQQDYVIYHLNHHVSFSPELLKRFVFLKNEGDIDAIRNRVIFRLSERALCQDHILRFDGIPMLFPISESNSIFHIDANDNLVFEHDIIKSAFYLLSGYQEYENPNSSDNYGRFAYSDSIQSKQNFIQKPIVNYYFELIIDGLMVFAQKNNITISRKKNFQFSFILSHDIDAVDLYTHKYILYKLKEIFHLRPSRLSSLQNTRLMLSGLLKYTGLTKNDNPYWNFSFMRELERQHSLKSVFYFLDQGVENSDADYSFEEGRLRQLFKYVQEEGCEVGLHGSVESVSNQEKMRSSLEKLRANSHASISGIRQHRLLWKHPTTALIQKALGFQYDTTLGFSAHEGFRNSYCHPFKLFDFEKDCTIDLWEFPLNIMDVTLFSYQSYNPDQARRQCRMIIDEVQKFQGVLSVLWHNSFFDDLTYPGVSQFYKDLLSDIASRKPKNMLGQQLVIDLKNIDHD
jgi:hypothetical protein